VNNFSKKENTVMDLNKLILIGRLGTDPETKSVPREGGEARPVASFRFAVNSPFDDTATWFTVECWGGMAEVVGKLSLHKGSRAYIEGKLAPDKDTGGPHVWIPEKGERQGTPQATFVVWADSLIALDKKEAGKNGETQ
jgi:single-strand DNA-binding protein